MNKFLKTSLILHVFVLGLSPVMAKAKVKCPSKEDGKAYCMKYGKDILSWYCRHGYFSFVNLCSTNTAYSSCLKLQNNLNACPEGRHGEMQCKDGLAAAKIRCDHLNAKK